MNLLDFFKDVLREQLEYDKDKSDHIINTQDVMLEDIIAVGGNNAPWVTKMNNNKFEIIAKTAWMTAYAGWETSGLHKSGSTFGKSELGPKFIRAYFVLTHVQLTAVTSNDSAVINASTEYSEEIRNAMARAKSRHLRWDGSGIAGVLPDDLGVQTWTSIVISWRAPGTIDSHNIYGLGTDEFQDWEPILFGTSAALDAKTAVEAVIETVEDEVTVKTTASVTVWAVAGANNRGGTNADTWYIVRGTNASSEWKTVPMGIFGLIDQGDFVWTLQGKDRSTTPWMKSIVMDKANATNIIQDFKTLYNKFKKFGRARYFKVSEDVYDKYSQALTLTSSALRNNADYKTKLGAGHSGLVFNYGNSGELPIMNDTFFPYGQVLLVDPMMFFEASLFDEDFIPGYFMKPIDAATELSYETARGAYMNFWTYGSRKLGAKINYQTV